MKLKKLRITRAKRTAMGRFVCRLLGEECGAVAMEYVVIALLIVAAAVGAAVYFGKTVKFGLEKSAKIVTNPDKKATANEIKNQAKTLESTGKATSKNVSDDIAGGTNVKNE